MKNAKIDNFPQGKRFCAENVPIWGKLILLGHHVRPRDGFHAVQHLFRRAREDDLAAHRTAARAELDEVVASL